MKFYEKKELELGNMFPYENWLTLANTKDKIKLISYK